MARINLNDYELKQIREAIQRGDKYIIIPAYELFIAFHPLRITSSTDKELHFGTSAYDRRMIKKWLKENK